MTIDQLDSGALSCYLITTTIAAFVVRFRFGITFAARELSGALDPTAKDAMHGIDVATPSSVQGARLASLAERTG